jgi:hypothetical protein
VDGSLLVVHLGQRLCKKLVRLALSLAKDESLEDSANLPDPHVIAAEIAENLQAALDQFAQIAPDLRKKQLEAPLA